jgi:hypothetical protein
VAAGFSFKSSLARVFQNVGLALIISTTHPDAPLPLIWVEGFGSKTEEIWSLRDTQSIGGLSLNLR